MKKWMRRLKRWLTVEHVPVERLQLEEMRHEDCLCICATAWRCPSMEIEDWMAALEHRGVRWMILMEKGMEAWNPVLMRRGIEFRGEAVVSVSPHPDTYHPSQIVLEKADLMCLPAVNEPMDVLMPEAFSIAVNRPAVALLKTNALCFPSDTAIGAVYENKGKLVVIGCASIVLDKWLEKRSNAAFMDHLLDWLFSDEMLIRGPDPALPPVPSNRYRPDISSMAEMPRYCMHLNSQKPGLEFRTNLFAFHLHSCTQVKQLSAELGVPQMNLSIIAPQFLTPTPALRPAVFPLPAPALAPPPLELFDLDAEICDQQQQLDQCFHKSESLAGFVEQGGQICNIRGTSPADILFKVFEEIAQYKR